MGCQDWESKLYNRDAEAIFTDDKKRQLLKKINGMGRKADNGKDRWDLVSWDFFRKIVSVLTFGAKKYADNNWQTVENPGGRYFAAAQRHIADWKNGEKNDSESGLPHLAHAACCLMFLMWFDE